MDTADASDRRLGFSLLFVIVAFVGAAVMLVASMTDQLALSGWGFAAAMLGGALAIAALQLYE
ncbi:DUF7525 family protein [Halosegnis longus]|uniref:Uncharacterized protein n=1 Tax=Halosegnis longus TaxID=2216012 RepID=A0AAJ4R9W7_9EURY|nr:MULTISPECIES: hypothetical protein [Halobacteriales]RNJ26892.1 hypothetical protein Nmn1133_09495 [Salella cibi]